jgi:hypothetical protein
MNKLLILPSLAAFVFEALSTTQVSARPMSTQRVASVTVERRAVAPHDAGHDSDASCTVRIFTMTKGDGSQAFRKSIDCEE